MIFEQFVCLLHPLIKTARAYFPVELANSMDSPQWKQVSRDRWVCCCLGDFQNFDFQNFEFQNFKFQNFEFQNFKFQNFEHPNSMDSPHAMGAG